MSRSSAWKLDRKITLSVSGYIHGSESEYNHIQIPTEITHIVILFYEPRENIRVIARFRPPSAVEIREERSQDLDANELKFRSFKEIVIKRGSNTAKPQIIYSDQPHLRKRSLILWGDLLCDKLFKATIQQS